MSTIPPQESQQKHIPGNAESDNEEITEAEFDQYLAMQMDFEELDKSLQAQLVLLDELKVKVKSKFDNIKALKERKQTLPFISYKRKFNGDCWDLEQACFYGSATDAQIAEIKNAFIKEFPSNVDYHCRVLHYAGLDELIKGTLVNYMSQIMEGLDSEQLIRLAERDDLILLNSSLNNFMEPNVIFSQIVDRLITTKNYSQVKAKIKLLPPDSQAFLSLGGDRYVLEKYATILQPLVDKIESLDSHEIVYNLADVSAQWSDACIDDVRVEFRKSFLCFVEHVKKHFKCESSDFNALILAERKLKEVQENYNVNFSAPLKLLSERIVELVVSECAVVLNKLPDFLENLSAKPVRPSFYVNKVFEYARKIDIESRITIMRKVTEHYIALVYKVVILEKCTTEYIQIQIEFDIDEYLRQCSLLDIVCQETHFLFVLLK